ncbi:BnaC01g30460D [Brassica napus]|uniref:BnaC01g30460D protein n=1 Tax=Brassica napus TaxID=3708 RepID=A0A078I5I6_BRANA|nr:BnaC01g30460D [Brassica napus]
MCPYGMVYSLIICSASRTMVIASHMTMC